MYVIFVMTLYAVVIVLMAVAVMVEYKRFEIGADRKALIHEQLMAQPASSVLPATKSPQARSLG
jgi:hypothetical protein